MDRINNDGHESGSIAETIEATRMAVINSIPTERQIGWLQSDGEMLINRFNGALEARQKAWKDTPISVNEQHREIQEIETLSLYHSVGGVDVSSTIISDLFSQPEKLKPLMQRKLLEIYGESPDLARSIIHLPIVGGHGSRSGSLVDTLIHGLRPTDYQKAYGIHSLNGTYDWGGNNFNRRAVSFVCLTNDRDLIHFSHRPAVNIQNISGWMKAYEKEHNDPNLNPTRKMVLDWAKRLSDFLEKPNKSDKEVDIERCLTEDFPVLYLIDRGGAEPSNRHLVDSDISEEFAVIGGVTPEHMPIILVPKKNIAITQEMAKKYGWFGIVMDVNIYSDEEPF